MNLFKPAWKSTDPNKREKGIRKMDPLNADHQKIIVEFSRNEQVAFVRLAAVEKLTDLNLLVDIAQNEPNSQIKLLAVYKLVAVYKLTGQNQELDNALLPILTEIAKKDNANGDIGLQAISKITDQLVLAEIAKHAKITVVRKTSVYKLNNQTQLADFALNDTNEDVSLAAVEQLKDQDLLSSVAKNARSYSVRTKAYEKLGLSESQEAIADRAKSEIYNTGVEKLSDQSLLADVAINAKSDYTQKAAVAKINEQSLLFQIAQKAHQSYVGRAAIEKIDNQELLLKIAENAVDKSIQHIATLKLNNISNMVANLVRLFKLDCYFKEEIGKQLKLLHSNEQLSLTDKAEILQLNGLQVKAHKDSVRYSHSCGESGEYHDDEPAVYFNV